jgi:RNA polymerase sigma factor (sigma-70 family)
MIDDSELLRRYAQDRSEDAFSELVQRHLGFVYGVAVRRVGHDAQLAREVCQEVFTALATKAAALAHQPMLKGWLHTAARFSAARAVRSESRRRRREQAAHTMQELNPHSEPRQTWEQLRPVIDDMLGDLRERDREAVLLRFFEELTFAQVGQRLEISEDAARIRVSRALDEMSRRLSRRGISSTAAVIAACLGSQAAVAAPAGWTAVITGTAMTGAPAGTWLGIFKSMTKTQIGIGSALALAGASAVWLLAGKDVPRHEEPRKLMVQQTGTETPKEQPLNQPAAGPRPTEAGPQRSPPVTSVSSREARPLPLRSPARVWINAGRATPEATMETLLFAGAKGDLDMIVSGIELGAEMSAKLQSQLSPAEREQPNAPERLLARMLATSTASVGNMQVTSREEVDSTTILLRAQMENTDGLAKDREYTFRRSSDGWRMLVDQ